MTPVDPLPPDKVVALLVDDLEEATAMIESVAMHTAELDDPAQVLAVRLALVAVLARIRIADAELVARFCTLGDEVTVDGKRYWPSTTKKAERWDSPALVSRVAAACADWGVDRDTGEILPPAAFAEKVVTATAKVLGGLAPSTKWRSTYLAELGVDAAKYRTYERGHPKIGESQ